MSSPATFPRFLELPKEVQIHIWKHAANPSAITSLLISVSTYDLPKFPPAALPSFFFVFTQYYLELEEPLLNRKHLMGTCMLSRLITLETWKNDMLHLKRFSLTLVNFRGFKAGHCQKMFKAWERLAEDFEALIGELNDGSTGRA